MLIKRIKTVSIIAIVFFMLACSNDSATSPDDDQFKDDEVEIVEGLVPVTNNPSEIRGVKWRQHSDDEFLQPDGSLNWWLNLPEGTTKLKVLKALEASKVNSVVMRVDKPRRYKEPKDVNYGKAMDDIIDVIQVAKKNGLKLDFYLWARFWFERNGQAEYGNVKNAAIALKDNWFTIILDKAKEADVLDDIRGIILVETNADRVSDVKPYVVSILDTFNANEDWNDADGNPFFYNKTFITPGAGFGLDFRGVGDDNGKFFADIQGKCKNFAFEYKYMRAAHEKITFDDYYNVSIGGENREWDDDMEKNNAAFTKDQRKEFLNHFGATELTDYLNTYKDQYPAHANMIFWGDKWDGFSKTPPLSRQALHEILVVENENPGGHFFTLASSVTTNTSAQKFYLLDYLSPSQVEGWSGVSVYDEWLRWPTATPGY